ncbi:hypothetical protein U5N28_17450 [Lysinibacillus telephonicus]|uniref:Uncharacterized protein n=1 Tax=Lysinibacillus telephonicus TaxID=1714840 RepID=A0A431UC82_9BACI|nr:hypothetical protein [Lysinibacillus telephonicus]RTQ86384.1 hypothetical protein EKG35_20165 [Lysinibacillus telephonicus]
MGNIYSAQNIAAYFIYELNEQRVFINSEALQHLLAKVEMDWKSRFGHSAFSENVSSLTTSKYAVKEVYEAYKECGECHLQIPAKEWHLEYGKFQLVHRPYGVPAFTADEQMLINNIIAKYREVILKKVS